MERRASNERIGFMRGLRSFLLLGLVCVTSLLSAQGLQLMRPTQGVFLPATIRNDTKLVELMRMLRFYYVDSINDKELTDKAITALLQELDPHSYYIPKEQSEDAMSELMGHFYGVGIEFAIQRDTLVVMAAIPDAPAEKVGIRAGDKFLTVNGEKITNIKLTNAKVAKYLRGPQGSSVVLDVLRNKQVAKYTVVRDSIPLRSVDVAYQIRPGIGYVRVTRFAEPTVREFVLALSRLNAEGAKSFIIDFRGNGGGLMQASILMASLFLPKGAKVVYAKGKRTGRQDFEALDMGNAFLNSNLVVLVDENTASASEIVSGALQDWDRAIIVGRRTFGKGLVQNQFAFSDSSLYRITVARYYTPSNRLIQTPYALGGKDKYREAFFSRYKNGELFHRDSIHFPDSLKYQTLRTHRTVYGGGGIMPDIFIPLDTVFASKYVSRLLRHGLLGQWVLDYVTERRDSLERRYPDLETYKRDFSLSPQAIASLVAYAAKNGEKIDEGASQLSDVDIAEVNWYTKVYLARSLYNFETMHRILHLRDEEVKCALDLLENWEQKGKPILEKRE